MGLVEEILRDYGTIPQKLGITFLKTNPATWKQLAKNTDLPEAELRNGLALLIQRRFVKFFLLENEIIYFLDTEIVKRRIYFPLYLGYVKNNFSEDHFHYFKNVLVSGIHKETGDAFLCKELLDKNILRFESSETLHKKDESFSTEKNKRKRHVNQYVIADYDRLDNCIYHQHMYEYLCKVFNKAAGQIYKSVLKTDEINRNSILNNLESTKILLSENGVLINNKANIDEYLEYLCLSRILDKQSGGSNRYILSGDKGVLKKYIMNILIRNDEHRRIFNMIYDKKEVDDRFISLNGLISITKTSAIILKLQSVGLLIQKCKNSYKFSNKMENLWSVDLGFASNVITNTIEHKIYDFLTKYNSSWAMNYFKDNVHGNEIAWISDMIGLANDCLVLNVK